MPMSRRWTMPGRTMSGPPWSAAASCCACCALDSQGNSGSSGATVSSPAKMGSSSSEGALGSASNHKIRQVDFPPPSSTNLPVFDNQARCRSLMDVDQTHMVSETQIPCTKCQVPYVGGPDRYPAVKAHPRKQVDACRSGKASRKTEPVTTSRGLHSFGKIARAAKKVLKL